MDGFIHYGITKYPMAIDAATQKAFDIFIETARRLASHRSGGYAVAAPDVVDIHIAGNGWSLEHSTSEGRQWNVPVAFLWRPSDLDDIDHGAGPGG